MCNQRCFLYGIFNDLQVLKKLYLIKKFLVKSDLSLSNSSEYMYKLQVCFYISVVNFDGFHDDESGIYRYMWTVGTAVCGNNTVDFQDPHEFLHSAKHWTHNGYQKNLQLAVSAIYAVKCKYMHECMLCSANESMNNIRSILQCPCEVLYGENSFFNSR